MNFSPHFSDIKDKEKQILLNTINRIIIIIIIMIIINNTFFELINTFSDKQKFGQTGQYDTGRCTDIIEKKKNYNFQNIPRNVEMNS